MSHGPLHALEGEMLTAQPGNQRSGADLNLGGNSEDAYKTQVSSTKGKKSVPCKDMHKNCGLEGVDAVGQSVSQPVVDSVKSVKESVVGEASANPSVTDSMNESDDEVIIEKVRKMESKEKRGRRKMINLMK
ncbi:hypothetical protein LIER_43822 [Lithospermum erythrorhizon]|uniref:Uncharacterized protein n=1 Tax=Lithospermum erythrorhizon TaxID=34254 RepID=A0AAV3QZX1_LITER